MLSRRLLYSFDFIYDRVSFVAMHPMQRRKYVECVTKSLRKSSSPDGPTPSILLELAHRRPVPSQLSIGPGVSRSIVGLEVEGWRRGANGIESWRRGVVVSSATRKQRHTVPNAAGELQKHVLVVVHHAEGTGGDQAYRVECVRKAPPHPVAAQGADVGAGEGDDALAEDADVGVQPV